MSCLDLTSSCSNRSWLVRRKHLPQFASSSREPSTPACNFGCESGSPAFRGRLRAKAHGSYVSQHFPIKRTVCVYPATNGGAEARPYRSCRDQRYVSHKASSPGNGLVVDPARESTPWSISEICKTATVSRDTRAPSQAKASRRNPKPESRMLSRKGCLCRVTLGHFSVSFWKLSPERDRTPASSATRVNQRTPIRQRKCGWSATG